MTAAVGPPNRSSSSVKVLPWTGAIPNTLKKRRHAPSFEALRLAAARVGHVLRVAARDRGERPVQPVPVLEPHRRDEARPLLP